MRRFLPFERQLLGLQIMRTSRGRVSSAPAARRLTLECPHEPLPSNSYVYFDLSIEKEPVGRVVFELFDDVVPKTVEAFRSLCTGERGIMQTGWAHCNSEVVLHYKGIPFHRTISNFILQGGDIARGSGRANESILGYEAMRETLGMNLRATGKCYEHLAGTIAVASSRRNLGGAQFFVNLRQNDHLRGRFVVFGQVIEGGDVLERINSDVGTECGVPRKRCWVSECGIAGHRSTRDWETEMKDRYGADHVEDHWYLMPPDEMTHTLQPRDPTMTSVHHLPESSIERPFN